MKRAFQFLNKFPRTFWVANTLEIFERMAWYGFFAVSSLYITGPVSEGALGFSDEDRGILQAVVTFFLYLFPVVSGALADRYGFKKMLILAFAVLTPAYFLLGQFNTFPTFFLAFMLVALGAAMFKPVIIGTVSKTTDEKTGSLGFGIFYMMVNIGGFLGPIVAGILRGWDWKYVFMASAFWISLNFIFVQFYKEPTEPRQPKKNDKKIFGDIVEVLGNGRFFLTIFGLLLLLVMGSKLVSLGWISWGGIVIAGFGWIILNIVYDIFLRKAHENEDAPWYIQPMKVGDWKFGVFLLLMAGFWTAFNQLYLTLPLYIRDFTNTQDILITLQQIFGFLGLSSLSDSMSSFAAAGGQVKPEYLININAGAIIFFQVIISFIVSKLKPFTTIFWGVLITSLSFVLFIFGGLGWIVVAGILVFSFGEMMASPKSKEYTGNIAPPDKVAMYMGYFYWCVALGNLFGGILSGQMYAIFARDMNRPDIMWGIFAGLSVLTAILIYAFDKMLKKQNTMKKMS